MPSETLIKREEGRLHGFHEEAVVRAGGCEDFLMLAEVQGGRLFAEHVLTGGEGLDAKLGVGVGMSGDVNGVDAGGEQVVEGGGDVGGELTCEGLCAVGVAAPDGGERCVFDGLQTVGETGGGTAGADDAEADGLRNLRHGNRVARWVFFSRLAVLRTVGELAS